MIKLERERNASSITRALRGKRRVSRNLELLEGFRNEKFEFKSSVWKNAKDQLKKESHNKCAYCESPTAVVAHGDVEHFRPKSIYWWLAYCYDNYLYSCQICNQSFKSNHFPFAGNRMQPDFQGIDVQAANITEEKLKTVAQRLSPDPLNDSEGMPMHQFLVEVQSELAGLIDPYIIDPEPLFSWKVDHHLKEVSLQPKTQEANTVRIFDATKTFMGLNREELLQERYKTFNILNGFKKIWESLDETDSILDLVRPRIKDMMENEAPYAGMVRYFVNIEWQLQLD